MGEIVRFKRSVDDDLSAHFLEACSSVPEELNLKMRDAAMRALGTSASAHSRPSFKVVCLVVIAACLIGTMLARGVTSRWNNAVDSSVASQITMPDAEPQFAAAHPTRSDVDSWRRTRGAWAEYISRLESDPYYQYVVQEKRRFEARYPGDLPSE